MMFNSRTIKTFLQGCTLLVLAGAPTLVSTTAHAQSLSFVPVITAYSGTGTGGYVDGTATTSQFSSPHISDVDAAGNLYVPDTTNNVVRRVDINGNVCTYAGYTAGSGTVCPGLATAGPVCAAKTDSVGDGCPATQATLNNLKALRVDAFGNVVIGDVSNNRIRSVNAQTGIITTIVGTGATNTAGVPFTDGTLATAIKLDGPFDLAFDLAGNLYISDINDNYVILVTAVNGAITSASKAYRVAGTGTAGFITSDGGVADMSLLQLPRGLAIDPAGNIYISDYTNFAIRKVTSPFTNGVLNLANSFISTYAGNGTQGTAGTTSSPCCTGDGGPALQAAISNPQGIWLDAADNLYITQFTAGYESIRVVNNATHIITTLAGTGPNAHTGDGGAANQATLFSPAGVTANRNGGIFIEDSSNNRIRLVQSTTNFATTAVGASSAASNVVAQASAAVTPKSIGVTTGSHDFTLGTMTGCTLNAAAAAHANCSIPVTFKPATPGLHTTAVNITDTLGNSSYVGVVGIGNAPAVAFTPAAIATLAGTGTAGNTGNAGPASLATVNAPRGSTIDASGSLVFADTGNNVIRRIDHTTGGISVLAGSGTSGYAGDGTAATAAAVKLNAPKDVVFDPTGNLYITDTGNNVIREVNAQTGLISTVAGTATAGYTGDLGLATAATFNAPSGLAMDLAGRLYVADTGNNAIRRFVPNGGYIATVAGTGTAGYSGDTGQAMLARLNAPNAVVVDSTGVLYIADTNNDIVRKVTMAGVISTYAGMAGVAANAGDGAAATVSSFLSPSDVALDAAGDLYIAAGGQIRFVNAAGTVSTVAGNGGTGAYSGEGGAATLATIPSPVTNLAVDSAANIYLSDTTANLILTVSAGTPRKLDFGSVAPNTTSGPQTVSVVNTGNLPLVLSGLTISASYALQSSASTACTATTTLTAGTSCTLTVVFNPTPLGTIAGSITLTDNALNGTAVTQTIPLTGISAVPANPTTTTLTTNPTSLTYGNSIVLNAVVTGTALTGSVIFAVDGVTAGTVAVVNGQASLTLTKLAAGRRTLTATYTSDTVNATSNGSVQVSVTPAVLTVTASNASRVVGAANPAFAYLITGFLYNETTSVISGVAVFTSTATVNSAPGTYPIAFSSSTLSAANYSFVYAGATLTVTPPDFTLTAAPSTITMPAGQTANVTITLTPSGPYTGTVTLSCGTLPANVTCNFTSPTLTADGSGTVLTTQLVIATDNFNHISSAAPARRPGIQHLMPFSLAALPFLALCGLRRKRIGLRTLLGIVLLLSVGGITSCANAGLNIAATGTNTITLTGTDGANLSHNVPLTITLQ